MKIISSFLSDDHRRLDGLFNQFQRLLAQEAVSARETFSRFIDGLERHIEWEEELLFPQFEQRSSMTGVGPTAVMRSEHRCFKILIDRIQDRLSAGASPDGLDTQLFDALTVHNRREEKVLYACLDGLLSEEEAGMLINRMKDTLGDGRRVADSI
ncbi:hemerythrin domain-containing protein [Nitrospira sp. Nam74]